MSAYMYTVYMHIMRALSTAGTRILHSQDQILQREQWPPVTFFGVLEHKYLNSFTLIFINRERERGKEISMCKQNI